MFPNVLTMPGTWSDTEASLPDNAAATLEKSFSRPTSLFMIAQPAGAFASLQAIGTLPFGSLPYCNSLQPIIAGHDVEVYGEFVCRTLLCRGGPCHCVVTDARYLQMVVLIRTLSYWLDKVQTLSHEGI